VHGRRTLAVSVWYRNQPGGLLTGRRSRKTAVTESYAVVVPLNRGRGLDGKAVAPPLAGT
jgi:hypothetical protein